MDWSFTDRETEELKVVRVILWDVEVSHFSQALQSLKHKLIIDLHCYSCQVDSPIGEKLLDLKFCFPAIVRLEPDFLVSSEASP